MALAESQCYTIINTPELSDVFNEMKIKKDLGMCSFYPNQSFHFMQKIENKKRVIENEKNEINHFDCHLQSKATRTSKSIH